MNAWFRLFSSLVRPNVKTIESDMEVQEHSHYEKMEFFQGHRSLGQRQEESLGHQRTHVLPSPVPSQPHNGRLEEIKALNYLG